MEEEDIEECIKRVNAVENGVMIYMQNLSQRIENLKNVKKKYVDKLVDYKVFIGGDPSKEEKEKRFDKDKRTKFSLETVSKDYFNKLKDQCKGLFVEDFSKKIFSDDFRKQVEAFKEMKSQIDKKINIPIYFDKLRRK